MTTNEVFLQALNHEKIKSKYGAAAVRTWRSRALREKISLDFMIDFLQDNGYISQQHFLWQPAEGNQGYSLRHIEHDRPRIDAPNNGDIKAQLNKKFYAVRKQFSNELYANWYEWAKAEYAKDFPDRKHALTEVIFSQMTYGRYISRKNIPFAIKVLKEGKNILTEFNNNMILELQSL
jgi:hypothetical protein